MPWPFIIIFENKNALLEAVTVSLVDAIYDPVLSAEWHKELHQLCLSLSATTARSPRAVRDFVEHEQSWAC